MRYRTTLIHGMLGGMDVYQKLREHLDVMPVAFPETDSGIEIDILRRFFSEEEAEIALQLSMLPERPERIHRRLGRARMSIQRVREVLEDLDAKKVVNSGVTMKRGRREKVYGKLPFAVGLYEYQVDRLTRDFESEAAAYMDEAFMYDFMHEKPRQMRTIPINETILPDRNVSRYDSIRTVILESNGPFAVHTCICRQGRELLGEKCSQTELKDTCLALGPAAVGVLKEGRGTRLTKEEMLQFLTKAEKEGLVLQAQNSRHPVFICCCCSCCCAILSRVKKLPDPGRILRSNYFAEVNHSVCIGCGACMSRCPMDAIALSEVGSEDTNRRRPVSVDPARCIGCGLCFSVCPVDALQMCTRGSKQEPPSSAMMMYIRMFIGRFGLFKGGLLLVKAGLGFKV